VPVAASRGEWRGLYTALRWFEFHPLLEMTFSTRENPMRRIPNLMAITVVAGATLFATQRSTAQEQPKTTIPADPLKWNLDRLSKDPFKLIKATPDPAKGQVRFVLEFTRAPSFTERYDWDKAGGLVVFRFLDEDGVALRSVMAKLDGEIVAKAGARIRLLLPLPDEKILTLTHSIVAE
jgi:hypothetical protein